MKTTITPKPSTSNRAPLRVATPGILDRVQAAQTTKEVDKLEAELASYKYASSSTINKFKRLAHAAYVRIGTNTSVTNKAPRAKKTTTAAAA